MDTVTKVDPYKGSYLQLADGLVIVTSSAETEPDGYGGYLLDLDVTYIQGGRKRSLVNLSCADVEANLNTAEIGLEDYAEQQRMEQYGRKRSQVRCPKCGPLTDVPGGDKFAPEHIMKVHNQIHHTDN